MTTADSDDLPSGWAAVDLFRRCKDRFKQGWHDLPQGAARRWTSTVAIGFVLGVAATVGMTWAAKELSANGALPIDRGVLRWLGELVPRTAAYWMSIFGNSVVLWPLMIFAAGVSAWRRKPLQALSIFPNYALTQVIVTMGWLVWDRSAPGVLTKSPAAETFNSFPSGHVAHAVFAFGILFYLWWQSARRPAEKFTAVLAFLVVVGAVSVGRLAAGAHWPTDVTGAWVVGLMWLAVNIGALRYARAC